VLGYIRIIYYCNAVCRCGVNRINTVLQGVSVGCYRVIIILQSLSVRYVDGIIVLQSLSVEYIKNPYYIAVYVSVVRTGSILY